MFPFKIQAFVFLLLVSLCSSEHAGAPLRSGVAVADDGVLVKGRTSLLRRATSTTLEQLSRVLKKKNKVPKAAKSKKAKSAVTTPQEPSSQPASSNSSSQPASSNSSSQPTEACAAINTSTQKDALLALKEGLINNDALKLANWDINTDPCADAWTGITCGDCDEVTTINVSK